MKTTTIPAGYRLTVASWENDMDNCREEIVEGLTREHIEFYVSICKRMKSKNQKDDRNNFGNMYEPSDVEIEKLQEFIYSVYEKYGIMYDKEDEDIIFNCLYEIGLSGSDFYTRVCESYKVEHVPEDIVFEDVTDSFK